MAEVGPAAHHAWDQRVGDVVRLMSFRKGAANLTEITLAEDTPWVGRPLREVPGRIHHDGAGPDES